MPIKWGVHPARLLSTVSLAWCVLVGCWIWFTPITCESIGATGVGYRCFSDVSLFGPAPLVVPVLIAAVAVWAAWRSRRVVLGFSAFLLAVFTFISGFSIGRGYVPASGLLVLAAVLAAFPGSGQRKSAAA
jgi:hypothetical protein